MLIIHPSNYPSMIVTTHRSSLITSPTPGGTTETVKRNISGPAITVTEFTPASAESTEIARTRIH